MSPNFVTLEPNEFNTDGVALTLYFPGKPSVQEVTQYVVNNEPSASGLGVDVEDPMFEVVLCQEQPFEKSSRFQAHPTG